MNRGGVDRWLTRPRRTLGRNRGMTSEERFLFDLEGYLVVKGVLSPAEVAALNAIADRRASAPPAGERYRRLFRASAWGSPFQRLIDHPRIVPLLEEVVGSRFRLDHDFCVFMTRGGRGQDLHGGRSDENPDHWYEYRDGRIRTGLTVVAFALSPVEDGDGGFCCIPGSHKSNFPGSIAADVRAFRRRPHYVVQPRVEAGDVLFFTEALVHGTAPWTADHERRTLLYKYSPGHSAWMDEYYDADDYPGLTERQRRILAPPSVGERPPSVGA